MNDLVKYFLPSSIRGVYRFDERITRISTTDEAKEFVETKLRFLPGRYADVLRELTNLETVDFSSIVEGRLLSLRGPKFYTETKKRYQQYFSSYAYFNNQVEPKEGEPNYLEAEFVRRILAPILTSEGLLKFQPQTTIESYLADFSVRGSLNYVFEVDGFGKFASRQSLDKFLKRQNVLVRNGWKVFRYSYSDIVDNKELTRKQMFRILKDDERLRPFLRDQLSQHEGQQDFGLLPRIQTDGVKPKEWDFVDLVNDFYLVQDLYVSHQIQSSPKTETPLCIYDRLPYPLPLVGLALSDLYMFLRDIEHLFGLDFELPVVKLVYQDLNPDFERFFDPLIKVENEAGMGSDNMTINSGTLLTVSTPCTSPSPNTRAFPYATGLEAETVKDYVTYIAQSVFRYAGGTRLYQDKVLQHIFDGQDMLGIFPTGSGKSFCFWLPALLKPGLSIVICPLRSLMRDQRLTLENYGIVSADFINSDVKKAERLRIINDTKLGRVKLLYVAPERIRMREFLEELKVIQQFVKINYLIIDEAHCISEWGHDFRPSYLNIPYFRDQLKAHNQDLQVIALTATAGQMVRRDIVNLLSLRQENVLTETDLDRMHFSYQIEKVDGYEQKSDRFIKVLTGSIPQALCHSLPGSPGHAGIEEVIASRNKNDEKAIGIVYVVYADPHGRHSTADGLAHYLFETKKIIEPSSLENRKRRRKKNLGVRFVYDLEDFGTGRVRGFSSKEPSLCPNCFHYDYISGGIIEDESDFDFGEDIKALNLARGRKLCRHCGHEFNGDQTASPTDYDAITRRNQRAFKRGNLDILVATKGFGMGIDKASVRFVVHTSPPSSIESWYQEIGRAGRDEERAHCAAIADVPHERCRKELETMSGIKEPRCNWLTGCPHGKSGLCDYGKQHMFIKHSYAGVVPDIVSAVRTLDRLIDSFVQGSSGHVSFPTNHTHLTHHELSLFRLKVLGIVEQFSVAYRALSVLFDVDLRTVLAEDSRVTISTDSQQMQDRLRVYLQSNTLHDDVVQPIQDRIMECKQKYDAQIHDRLQKLHLKQYDSYQSFYNKIIDCLSVLLNHTYSHVVRMRYDMLWNLYNDIIFADGCRRQPILEYFSKATGVSLFERDEDYQCGLCDNCVRNLAFKLESRNPPSRSDKKDELAQRLDAVFESGHFEYPTLLSLREAFKEYPTSIYRRSRAILEGSPSNMVALYFTREFSPESEAEANTVRLLQTANRSLDMNSVAALYRSSRSDCKKKLLFLLNDEFGQFNSNEGIAWLHSKTTEELRKSHDERLRVMRDTLGFFILCRQMDSQYPTKLSDIKQEIEEAYYGRNN